MSLKIERADAISRAQAAADAPQPAALYTIPQAARLLAVSVKTIYNLIDAKKLHSVHINGAHRIPADEIRRIANAGTTWTPEQIAEHYARVNPENVAFAHAEFARIEMARAKQQNSLHKSDASDLPRIALRSAMQPSGSSVAYRRPTHSNDKGSSRTAPRWSRRAKVQPHDISAAFGSNQADHGRNTVCREATTSSQITEAIPSRSHCSHQLCSRLRSQEPY